MNMGRLLTTLVAILGLVASQGCSQPSTGNGDQQNPPAVTTDMEIVVPSDKE